MTDFNKSNPKYKIIPVILSGGSGTRLWPYSKACFPKQYLRIDSDDKFSLLQNTILRLKGIRNIGKPIIICNQEQRFIVAEQVRELNIEIEPILLEPVSRNTAPAIALAALISKEKYRNSILLILSADHIIKNANLFREQIEEGLIYAQKGRLVTFGVIPTKPETGYGYIESFDELSKSVKQSSIKRFIEKPNISAAKKFIKDKHFSWNSGIFLFKTDAIISEISKFEPKIITACKKSLKENLFDLDFQRIKEEEFKNCPNIPIDIAVMEKTLLGTVLPLDVGWSDIGDWKSVWENSHKDTNGNKLVGRIYTDKVKNSYLRSKKKLLVGVGLENLIVIDSHDSILVMNKSESQRVKEVVQELEKKNYSEAVENKQIFRPWGNYTLIENGFTWQVKRLEINPHATLSLQMHHHRSEHWIVVNGTAKVEIDSKVNLLSENQSIYIPLGSKHRLTNPGKIQLVLIEVQSGSYLGEDDIVRFEDQYGRKTK